jgi:PTH1 family peptidyl-tRNA hydrolase
LSQGISLIVGLGNPGKQYSDTRHNAGFRFLDLLLSRVGGSLKTEKKYDADCAQVRIADFEVRLLEPHTFMNLSGQSVQAYAGFYKIPIGEILVVHDELDLEPGIIRLKKGGGAGGHNGLKDIMQRMGKDFMRLRVGIGHPGQASQVSNYVLKKAPADEQALTDEALHYGLDYIDDIVKGEFEYAMNHLHTNKA